MEEGRGPGSRQTGMEGGRGPGNGQAGMDRFGLLIFTFYNICIVVSSVRGGWNVGITYLMLIGTVLCWYLSIKEEKDPRTRGLVNVLVSQLGIVIYAMHTPDIITVIPTFMSLIIFTGMLGDVGYLRVTIFSTLFLGVYYAVTTDWSMYGAVELKYKLFMYVFNTAMVEIVINIWVRKRQQATEQMINVIRDLKAAEHSKDDFLANVSHEIRTPINAICGMSEVALKEDSIDHIKEELLDIQLAGRNLMSIVSDVLDFSELQSDKIELVEEVYNITSTVNDVVNMALARTNEKNLELLVDCDATMPRGLFGDEKKIRRVIINLLNNALKYTETGYVSLSISFRKEDYGGNLRVEIRDTGIGMDQAGLDRLFTSFNQIDTKRNRQKGGIGLGLAISKAIVQMMGGIITVKSHPGKGTAFKFVIPQKVTDQNPIAEVEGREAIHAGVYVDMERFNLVSVRDIYEKSIVKMAQQLNVKCHLCRNINELKRRIEQGQFTHLFSSYEDYQDNRAYFDGISERVKIAVVTDSTQSSGILNNRIQKIYKPLYVLPVVSFLNGGETRNWEKHVTKGRFIAPSAHVLVVDDNEMNLRVVAGLLSRYKIKVTQAQSGKEALEKIESMDYDFVFMDHMMPEMDGVETLHHIREKLGSYYQTVPILALSANAVAGSREMFLSEGFAEFVEKPIEPSVLERVLKRTIPEEKQIYVDEKAGTRESTPAGSVEEEAAVEQDGLVIGDLDTEKGMLYCGDKEKYIQVLVRYAQTGDETADKMETLFKEENWKDYTIMVHATKSSMLSIGAVALSEMAKSLELAGKEGRIPFIVNHHEEMIREYRRVIGMLKEHPLLAVPEEDVVQEEQEGGCPELTDEALDEKYKAFEEAVFALDETELSSILSELKQYRYRGNRLAGALEEIEHKVAMFDHMSALALFEKLKARWQRGMGD